MTSRFKELKAQYDAVKLNMSKRKVHGFLEKLFQLAEQMESANDCADGIFSELIDRQKAEIVELKQQLTNPECNRKVEKKLPKSVADYLEISKGWDDHYQAYQEADMISLQNALSHENYSAFEPLESWFSVVGNDELFAQAWLDGDYEVEEEPKYYVVINEKWLISMFSNRIAIRFVEKEELVSWGSTAYKLTEKEIKDIDERYWPFAIPVEKEVFE